MLKIGAIELNPATRIVKREGTALNLTESEFQILELLMRSVGRVVSRAGRIEAVELSAPDAEKPVLPGPG